MKASKLIKLLEESIKKNGDMEVMYAHGDRIYSHIENPTVSKIHKCNMYCHETDACLECKKEYNQYEYLSLNTDTGQSINN